jgi:hypothetical protein
MHRLVFKASAVCAASLLAILLAGCGSDNEPNTQNENQIRLFNGFVPAAGASSTVNVASGGQSLTTANGLNACSFSPTSGYQAFSFANNSFSPVATGSGVTGSISATGAPLTLSGNDTRYSVVIAGQSGQVGTLQPQVFVIPDYTPAMLAIPNGQAAVRVVNLSPTASQFSLFNSVNGGAATAVGTGTSNIGYGFSQATNGYTLVTAGSANNLSLRDTANLGTDLTLNGGNLSNFTFQSGHAYTVFVCGQVGNANSPLTATVVQDFP